MRFLNLLFKSTRKTEPVLQPLTPEQVKILREIVHHPGWQLYVRLIDRYSCILGEQLLVQPDPNRLLDLRGEIRGLRNAPLLVIQEVLAEELNDEQRRSLSTGLSAGTATAYDTGPYS